MLSRVKISLVILFLLLLTGCNRQQIFKYDWNNFQSVSVWKYDFLNTSSTEKWVYRTSDTEVILKYLQNLKGVKDEAPIIDKTVGVAYGINIMGSEDIKATIIGNYVVMSDGQYFNINSNQIEELYNLLYSDERTFNIIMMMNHRYISLIDGKWNTKYMMESRFTNSGLSNINWSSNTLYVNQEASFIESTITNETDKVLEYGEEESFEVLIDNEWYSINAMTNGGLEIGWNSIQNLLEPGKYDKRTFYLKYYQPLPVGQYRLVKTISKVEGETGEVYFEFNVE